MSVYDYVTHPGTARTHLVGQLAMMINNPVRTLCGQTVEFYDPDRKWKVGDETMSGLASTCDVCKDRMQ